MPSLSPEYWSKFKVGVSSPYSQEDSQFTATPPPSPIAMFVFLNTNNFGLLNGNQLELVGILP